MQSFDYKFTVQAARQEVSAFHYRPDILKHLMPPPLYVQLHNFDPVEEGGYTDFTLWFGPLPIHWLAAYHDVGEHGFTDRQVQGPLQYWQHTHRFITLDPERTLIHEHMEYEHRTGVAGLLTRLVINRPGLWLMFLYRRLVTTLALEPKHRKRQFVGGVLAASLITVMSMVILFRRLATRALLEAPVTGDDFDLD